MREHGGWVILHEPTEHWSGAIRLAAAFTFVQHSRVLHMICSVYILSNDKDLREWV